MPDVRWSPPTRRLRLVAAISLVVALSTAGTVADAQDARTERSRVQAEKAEAAAQVDALKGDQAAIGAALEAIDINVTAAEAEAATAAQVAETAAAEALVARQSAEASAAQVGELKRRVTAYAVSAYVNPPGADILTRFQAGSAQEDATRQALLTMKTGRDTDLVDQLRAAQRRYEDDLERAEATRAAAEETRARAEGTLASLTTARAQQEQFAAQVRQRLDSRLAEIAVLERRDADLARRIRAEEEAVAAALRARTPAPAHSATEGGSGGSSGGGPSGTSGSRVPTPPLRSVGGNITVHASIADQVAALLAAARADGLVFTGYGYRGSGNQVGLRMQNCGTSDYAIYQMPPEQCSPPTARPGSSLHEQGLAIDFQVNGSFLSSRSDPGFVWLAANASRFGLYNLPSEPWHWSTTGG